MESSKSDCVNINILFFAKAKDLVKKSSAVVRLPSRINGIDNLLDKVEIEFPELKTLNRCFVLALNEDYLGEYMDTNQSSDPSIPSNEIQLSDGDELAVIPPLSGG